MDGQENPDAEEGKQVILLDIHNNEAMKNGAENESNEKDEELGTNLTSSSENGVAQQKIFNVKEKAEQVGINANVETRVLEAQPADTKNLVLVKLLRASRYFDPIDVSQRTCYTCGEDNHITAECVAPKKKKKHCYICAHLGHDGKRCKKVNKCFFCYKRGHLAKDCPEKNIVSEHISNFCLRCGDLGHDLLSCNNNYSPDDLERISCLVCNAFGHLSCANISGEGPIAASCYNCGQSGHLGSECMELHDNGQGLEPALLDTENGSEGHLAKEFMNQEEGKKVGAASLGVISEDKEGVSGVKHKPNRYRRVRWRKIRNKDRQNASQGLPWRKALNYIKQQKHCFEEPGSNVWLSPVEAAKRNHNLANSQTLDQNPR